LSNGVFCIISCKKNKNCKRVDEFSIAPQNGEVLFARNTTYKGTTYFNCYNSKKKSKGCTAKAIVVENIASVYNNTGVHDSNFLKLREKIKTHITNEHKQIVGKLMTN